MQWLTCSGKFVNTANSPSNFADLKTNYKYDLFYNLNTMLNRLRIRLEMLKRGEIRTVVHILSRSLITPYLVYLSSVLPSQDIVLYNIRPGRTPLLPDVRTWHLQGRIGWNQCNIDCVIKLENVCACICRQH